MMNIDIKHFSRILANHSQEQTTSIYHYETGFILELQDGSEYVK